MFDFLYAHPSVSEGVARILDFGNTLEEYNYSSDPDIIAIYIDWKIVGNGLREAMRDFKNESGKEKQAISI